VKASGAPPRVFAVANGSASAQIGRMRFIRWAFVFVALTAPLWLQAQREKLPPEDLAIVEKNWPDAQRTSIGLRTQVLKPGAGELVQRGDLVSVLYKGQFLNGTVFDQSEDREKPFTFRVGRGQVIEGWEYGLQMMRPGEKRLLIVPFELGYGTRGDPPKIPRRATLVFEVELLEVKK
jgi:FKBP-type peptidyl-prolyl cis-trans isomerase